MLTVSWPIGKMFIYAPMWLMSSADPDIENDFLIYVYPYCCEYDGKRQIYGMPAYVGIGIAERQTPNDML
jgi:hypothetical protein